MITIYHDSMTGNRMNSAAATKLWTLTLQRTALSFNTCGQRRFKDKCIAEK